MTKLIKVMGIGLFFILGLCSLNFAEEQITITTYYPSPYGSYNELTTHSNTYLATEGGSVGIGTVSPHSQAKLDVREGNLVVANSGASVPNSTHTSGDIYLGGNRAVVEPGSYSIWRYCHVVRYFSDNTSRLASLRRHFWHPEFEK